MSILDMTTLAAGRPVGLTANEGGRMMECAVVSFESAGHSVLPRLQFDYPSGTIYHDLAGPSVTQQMRKTHGDLKVAVES